MASPVRALAGDLKSVFFAGMHCPTSHAKYHDRDRDNDCRVQTRPNNPVHRHSPCSDSGRLGNIQDELRDVDHEARGHILPDGRFADSPVQPHQQKYFASLPGQITCVFPVIPCPPRGAFRDRHERWVRGAMDARAATDERGLSGRQSRVVLTPQWLVSSSQ